MGFGLYLILMSFGNAFGGKFGGYDGLLMKYWRFEWGNLRLSLVETRSSFRIFVEKLVVLI
jgi:hypothetical protein